jgi:hypothetical protein
MIVLFQTIIIIPLDDDGKTLQVQISKDSNFPNLSGAILFVLPSTGM